MAVSDETPEDKPEDHIRPGKISADSVDFSEDIERIREEYPHGGPLAEDPSAYPGQLNSPSHSDAAAPTTQDPSTADQATEPPSEGGTTS